MSKIKNGRLGLYGTEHSKCNHMMTRGFKGLMTYQNSSSVRFILRCATLFLYTLMSQHATGMGHPLPV